MEWVPDMPTTMSDADLAEYRRGRDVAMAELARLTGGRVVLVEL
jgi:hypothetical protein